MKSFIFILCLLALEDLASAGQGPAGASGACSHVLGSIDAVGNPLGFTCSDTGGSALLVWNATQLNSNVTVTGGISVVNFNPGDLTVSGTFTSGGPLAFVGHAVTITGSITGSGVLIAAVDAGASDVLTQLLGPSGRLTTSASGTVITTSTSKITATTDNVVIAGNSITNGGQLNAKKSVLITAGNMLDVGWNDVVWMGGIKTKASGGFSIVNDGTIIATNIILEAHGTGAPITTIRNQNKLSANETVTFVTGSPGLPIGSGYAPRSFGIVNANGTIYAATVTISPYFVAAPGGLPNNRSFNIKDASQRQQIQTDIDGVVQELNTDNTPTGTSAAVIDSGTSNTNTFTVTSSLVIPQLAPSLTHLNATANAPKPVLVVARANPEQVRGVSTQPVVAKPKPRVKAKPVLVRGAFFESKISAVLSPNP